MKNWIALTAGLVAATAWTRAQDAPSTALVPFNPDSDGSGNIEIVDILNVLPYFGQPFVVEGVVGVEYGGTGATTVEGAREALGLSLFKDSLVPGQTAPWGWVNGTPAHHGQLLARRLDGGLRRILACLRFVHPGHRTLFPSDEQVDHGLSDLLQCRRRRHDG